MTKSQEKVRQTAGHDALGEFAPEFAHLNDDILFGEVWSRNDLLSLRDRSIVTVVALIGQSYLAPVVTEGIPISNVTFEPGCRNNWHIHKATKGGGQILVCVGGRGYYQEWGKEPVELLPGDAVYISAGVKHWHGAAPDSWFSHLAIEAPGENKSNEWLEPVSEEEYSGVVRH